MRVKRAVFHVRFNGAGRLVFELTEFGRGWFYADRTLPKNPDFEAKHPRAEAGRFGKKGFGSTVNMDGAMNNEPHGIPGDPQSLGSTSSNFKWFNVGKKSTAGQRDAWASIKARARQLKEIYELDDLGLPPDMVDGWSRLRPVENEPAASDLMALADVHKREYAKVQIEVDGKDMWFLGAGYQPGEFPGGELTGTLGLVIIPGGKGVKQQFHTHAGSRNHAPSAKDCDEYLDHKFDGGEGGLGIIARDHETGQASEKVWSIDEARTWQKKYYRGV